MTDTVRPALTPGRLAWLRKLAAEGSARMGYGRAAYECRQLGWTEWEVPVDGSPGRYTGFEVLTDAGRQMLAEHEAKSSS